MYGADGGVVGYAASSGASMSAPPGPSPSFVVFDPAPSYQNLRQHSRIPTPNRLRSNSSGANLLAYSDTETLADIEPPPPLPSLYRPDSRQQPHAAFPGLPASPSTPIPMSSLSSHAPEAPHRLAGGVPLGSTPPSGIPVLKSRTRSNPRPPSPEFAVGEESLRDAAPPFRVDLDATLAEIEDELEARAAERYMLAKPSPAPRTPSAPTTPITPHTRSSRNGNGGANGTGSVSNRPKRRISQQQPSPKASVTTPLGRSATLNGHSPAGSVGRSTLNARKRHGSDSAHVALAGTPKTPRTPRAGSSTPRAVVRASTDTPRSNLGTTPPTQKHIGIAAHFIPPENSYTPPKGADWDDVVLPTVARKTGISVASRNGHGQAWASGDDDDEDGPSGDDDLAVEWDKDGNPIRWEPQTRERVPRERGPVSYSSDFGPSFPRPGRRDTANDSIELTPIRASAGQPSALEPASNSRRQSRVPEQAQPQTQPQRQPSVHAPAVQADSFAQTLAPPPGKKRGKKRADNSDEVKAGCGCVIM
ncbi:hypothetical protein Q8F55_004622 [Vanrija albida]|uniref:Shugoshin C-terminal domain-containing protein n=1 Tax=Vanrija albida TaxID=181172 RepID=A0ABR3Q780_9TREE